MLLSNQWITEKIKMEIKITWRQMKMKTQQPQIHGLKIYKT